MAKMVSVFAGKADDADAPALRWSESAIALLNNAPDKIEMLKVFTRRFSPNSWSGSRAAVMETRVPLLKELGQHQDSAIADFAKAEIERFKKEIELEKRHETERDKERDERFE